MDEDELCSRVQEHFDRADDLPGVVVAVQRGPDVTTCALGVADVETGRPVTTDTVFHLASISKVYNATLVMSLVDDGRLDLDAPIATVLPDFAVADPDTTARVTLRHLLTHTSGIDGDKFTSFGQGDDALAKYVADCRTLGQVHPLGSMWSYCNSGANIAGHVAATAAGASWDDALRDRVLATSGAQRSGTRPEDVIWWPVAVPHATDGGKQVPMRHWQSDRSSGPAGGVLATAEDLLRFVGLHARDGQGVDGTTVLKPETARSMRRPLVALPDGADDDTHAGLGWALRVLPDGPVVVGHGGDLLGIHSRLNWVPEKELVVVVLGNGDGIDTVAKPILDALLEDVGVPALEAPRVPEELPQVDVRKHAGRYETVAVELDLVIAGDHLEGTLRVTDPTISAQLTPEQREQSVTFFPVAEDRWVAQVRDEETPMRAVFFRNGDGRFLHMGGRAMTRRDRTSR